MLYVFLADRKADPNVVQVDLRRPHQLHILFEDKKYDDYYYDRKKEKESEMDFLWNEAENWAKFLLRLFPP